MNQVPSSPPSSHPRKKKAVVGPNKINFHKHDVVYLILLLVTNVLVYLSASSSSSKSSKPAMANQIDEAAAHATTSHDPTYYFSAVCADPIPPQLVRETIIRRVFKGTSPWENFPPQHLGSYLVHQENIKGWGSHGAVFENLIRRVKPKTIIEIGTFLGASALHMAELTRRLGLETQIICVDDFRGWPQVLEKVKDLPMVNGDIVLLSQFMQNVMDANATDSISFMPFSSETALETFCEWGVYADLVEVDASSYFHSAWTEINRGYKLLSPGGIIFGHDYFLEHDNRGVKRAVDLFARANNLHVQVDGEHWVLLPPKFMNN